MVQLGKAFSPRDLSASSFDLRSSDDRKAYPSVRLLRRFAPCVAMVQATEAGQGSHFAVAAGCGAIARWCGVTFSRES